MQCNFKHEEDVDRFLAYIEETFPQIPVHSAEAERKLEEKEKWLAERQKEKKVSEETRKYLSQLEQAEKYLKNQSDIYMDLSQSAKKKRTRKNDTGSTANFEKGPERIVEACIFRADLKIQVSFFKKLLTFHKVERV